MKITNASLRYEREKLKSPFGFKGGFLSELWQVITKAECDGICGTGVSIQSVLWSDADIFGMMSEDDGNLLMYRITEYAVKLIIGKEGKTPIDIIDGIYPRLLSYAKSISPTGEKLSETFVRNALVSVDNALWQLYGRLEKTEDIMSLIPTEYRAPLRKKHEILCNIPLLSYGVKSEEIKALLDGGTVLLKIKIGFDNGGKMTKAEMLEWDKNRILEIHNIAKNYKTPYTESGNILYYMDANSGYDTKQRLSELLDFARENGILDRIVLLEEPFKYENETNVSDMGVRIAADESVHSLEDVKKRIGLGYSAITLKAVAKTLSETLKILACAYQNGVPCFCADLTVNPVLLGFNMNIASRIDAIPGMKIGILESNGMQNYVRWDFLTEIHPMYGADFVSCKNGLYTLGDDFYSSSGGIFRSCEYYEK